MITVVVLIILAGISISMLTGENGIINRVGEAKEKNGKVQTEETLKVAVMDALSQGQGTVTSNNLKSALNNVGQEKYEVSEDEEYIKVKIANESFDIRKDGKIQKILPKSAAELEADAPVRNPLSYGDNAQATADGAGKYFAKPEGATYLEGTVDTGVVVDIKGSEFVWVPVEDVVFDTSRDEELPKSSKVGTSSGKIYTPMAVKVGDNYKGLLYEFSGSNGYLKYNQSSSNYLGGESDYREPDVISKYDGGNSDTVVGKITQEKLTVEYNAMIESVLKYKGFYVARYEAGLDNITNAIVFKNASIGENNVTTTDASNNETSSWYGLYKKIKTFTTNSDKVQSSMIWGSQYDAMMNWMAKNKNDLTTPSKSKTNSEKVTGKNTNDIINNVYDLYGCNYEWTLEAFSDYRRVMRGGYYGNNLTPSYSISYNTNATEERNISSCYTYNKVD